MNSFRQTPHKDFVRVRPTERFGQLDRWNGKTERPLPKFKLLATLFAFTSLGVLALAD